MNLDTLIEAKLAELRQMIKGLGSNIAVEKGVKYRCGECKMPPDCVFVAPDDGCSCAPEHCPMDKDYEAKWKREHKDFVDYLEEAKKEDENAECRR